MQEIIQASYYFHSKIDSHSSLRLENESLYFQNHSYREGFIYQRIIPWSVKNPMSYKIWLYFLRQLWLHYDCNYRIVRSK
jgi:hypothetical protein